MNMLSRYCATLNDKTCPRPKDAVQPYEKPSKTNRDMAEKYKLIIALGSNHNQEKNIETAKSRLHDTFKSDVVFTQSIWTEPIGIESDMFLNCLAFILTKHKLTQVQKVVKNIERLCGSTKGERRENIIRMDIDILLYGEQRMHEGDWEREYVKTLIKDDPFKYYALGEKVE